MIFIDPNNNYPRHVGDIKLAHPEWNTKDPLPNGWTEVQKVQQPKADPGYFYKETFPVKIDGVFSQNWELAEIPENYFDPVFAEQEKLQGKLP